MPFNTESITVALPIPARLIYFVPMLTKELSALKRVQPSFIEPMYAEAVRVLPDGGLWTYEAKLDGYRCLAAKRSGRITLWSRRANGFTHRFPEIAQACEKLPHYTLIDDEVVALDEVCGLQERRAVAPSSSCGAAAQFKT